MNRTSLDITGMHCASCVSKVEKALGRVPGVSRASVNLLGKSASVWHEDDPPAGLVEAIRGAGFDAHLRERSSSRDPDAALPLGEGTLGRRFAFTFAVAWATMFLSMPMMHHEAGSTPAAFGWLMTPFDALTRVVFPFLYELSPGVLRWTLLLLTLPVIVGSGRHFFTRTLSGLPRLRFDMDSLVAIGTGTAFLYSAAVTLAPGAFRAAGLPTDVYFEAVPWVLSLVTLGRLLEERAKRRAGEAVRRLADRVPRTARLLRDGREVDVPLEEVRVDDRVVLRPGEKVPVDGIVETGHSALDESMLTGESMPIERGAGDPVTAGTVNGNGSLTFAATRVGEDTAVARIIALLDEAMAAKPDLQRTVDRVAAVFVPVVLGLAVLTLLGWWILGPGLAFGIRTFVAVLIIACPCAMGLAVPAAIAVATGRAASLGVLIRDGRVLETAHRVDTLVLDKTGTVTVGRPEVAAFQLREGATLDVAEALALSAALERRSEHPLAAAIVRHAESEGAPERSAITAFTLPGGGVFGKVGERKVRLGTATLLREKGVDPSPLDRIVARFEGEGSTPVLLAVDGEACGVFAIRDPLQDHARETIARLKALGLRVILLTGDRRRVAESVAAELGLEEVRAEVSPQGKIDFVRQLRREGHTVLMAGDGINDAPALAAADLGVAMGSGADVAREAADVILVAGRLASLPGMLTLFRAALRILRQNLAWAFGYNVVAIPLAAGLFYPWTGWLLSPVVASAAMALSSVSVVSNSLRLRRKGG
jgi:Cu+-exporting ATPase